MMIKQVLQYVNLSVRNNVPYVLAKADALRTSAMRQAASPPLNAIACEGAVARRLHARCIQKLKTKS